MDSKSFPEPRPDKMCSIGEEPTFLIEASPKRMAQLFSPSFSIAKLAWLLLMSGGSTLMPSLRHSAIAEGIFSMLSE